MKLIMMISIVSLLIMCSGCSKMSCYSKGKSLLAEGKGIESYYYILESGISDKDDRDKKEVVMMSRELAILELTDIYLKPKEMHASNIYYDNEDKEKIKYILSRDNDLQKKFLP